MQLLETMLLSRQADHREALLVRQGVGRFQVSSAGHEAVAALAVALRAEDIVFPHYRDRALLLARGVPLEVMARDFLAREGSSSAGRNMPQHYSYRRANVFSIASPVASQCLPAVGAAWRARADGGGAAVLCCLGDGSARQGEFFEALCMARQERLPVVFVVEDNGYAISTPTRGVSPLDLGMLPADMVTLVDGADVQMVAEAGVAAFETARSGGGPVVLWCRLERLASHSSSDDHRRYRGEDELRGAAERDPIALWSARLIAAGELTTERCADLEAEVAARVAACYDGAVAAPVPPPESLAAELYGAPISPPSMPAPAATELTLAEAVNWALATALEQIPTTSVWGEDVEDPMGGVFGLTRGLSRRFPGRVTNTPLAEATIIGMGVGLAAAGLRPIVELQFIDFIGPGLNQLISQVATLRWRSNGEWTCPLVLYAPYGGYVAGGIWHSQSNEGWWTHLPGLMVAAPSTVDDVLGLFWTAVHQDDPALILLPKRLFGLRQKLTGAEPVPFGAARVVRHGGDVTVVTWGNGVPIAAAAAEELAAEGVEVELLDLRSLTPCDWTAIRDSVSRTGRLVVVQEDSRTSSFGGHIVAELTASEENLALHLAAPRLVSRGDMPVPYGPTLEQAALPQPGDVADAVRLMME